MTVSTLLTIIVGVLIPAAVAAVTRRRLNTKIKAVILVALSTLSAAITTTLTSPPHDWSQWQHFAVNLGISLVSAIASTIATWYVPPAKTTVARIHAFTDPRFGLGPDGDASADYGKAA